MKKQLTFLMVIILAGAGIRLWQFDAVAPSTSDEAMYLRQGRFMSTLIKHAVGVDVPVINEDASGIWRYVRKDDWYTKPCWLHSGFIAIAMLAMGTTTMAGAMISFLFSLAAVPLVWLIARRLLDDRSAFVSAGMLAVSSYWMIYARGLWAEVDSTFFVMLSFYLSFSASALRERPWMMILSGVIAAVALLCNYRLIYICIPVGISVLVMSPHGRKLRSVLLTALGYLVVIVCVEFGLKLLLGLMSVDIPFSGLMGSYLDRLTHTTAGSLSTGFQMTNGSDFLHHFIRNHGYAETALTVLGVAFVVRSIVRRRPNSKRLVCVLLYIAIVLMVFTFQVWVVARAVSILIPFVCLLAAAGFSLLMSGVDRLEGRMKWMGIGAVTVILCVVMIESMRINCRLLGNRMGHQDVAEFLVEQGATEVYCESESALIYKWHAPDVEYKDISKLMDVQIEGFSESAYLIFDAGKYNFYPSSRPWVDRVESVIRSNGPPVLVVDNLTTMWPEFIFDATQSHSLEGQLKELKTVDVDDITTIRVYRVGGEKG